MKELLSLPGKIVEKGGKRLLSALVIPLGFEPKTCCLEGSCSIQLSYGTRPF